MACSKKELNTDRAVELNITAKRNDTFNPFVTLLENGTAFDFTGFNEANMQVKSASTSDTVIILMSLANSRLTLGGSTGVITWAVEKEDMDITEGTYVYDLEIINTTSGERETVLVGKFQIVNDVTRV